MIVLRGVIFIFNSASGGDQRKLDVRIIHVPKLFMLGVSSIFDQTVCMPFDMLIKINKLLQVRTPSTAGQIVI